VLHQNDRDKILFLNTSAHSKLLYRISKFQCATFITGQV